MCKLLKAKVKASSRQGDVCNVTPQLFREFLAGSNGTYTPTRASTTCNGSKYFWTNQWMMKLLWEQTLTKKKPPNSVVCNQQSDQSFISFKKLDWVTAWALYWLEGMSKSLPLLLLPFSSCLATNHLQKETPHWALTLPIYHPTIIRLTNTILYLAIHAPSPPSSTLHHCTALSLNLPLLH